MALRVVGCTPTEGFATEASNSPGAPPGDSSEWQSVAEKPPFCHRAFLPQFTKLIEYG